MKADDDLAHALLVWYDSTHGNVFGHDHHCPAPWLGDGKAFTQPVFEGCTCGWSKVQQADAARAEAYKELREEVSRGG